MIAPDFRHEALLPRRPHAVASSGLGSVKVINAIRKTKTPTGSHLGLMVTIGGTVRVLRQAGIDAYAWEVESADELWSRLEQEHYGERKPTHVIINTPQLVGPWKTREMARKWPNTEFATLSHTAVVCQHIDGDGTGKNRQIALDSEVLDNVKLAYNNERSVRAVRGAYRRPALYLPNLYDVTTFADPVRARRDHDPLRIGAFGIPRHGKNPIAAAYAALELAERLGVAMQYFVNDDPWGKTYRDIWHTRAQLFRGTRHVIIPVGWLPWPEFRLKIAQMDICLNPSWDESFNVTVADGIAVGVPSVVTRAMEWTPPAWQVTDPHDTTQIVTTSMALLHDPLGAVHDGRDALKRYVRDGVATWIGYLTRDGG